MVSRLSVDTNNLFLPTTTEIFIAGPFQLKRPAQFPSLVMRIQDLDTKTLLERLKPTYNLAACRGPLALQPKNHLAKCLNIPREKPQSRHDILPTDTASPNPQPSANLTPPRCQTKGSQWRGICKLEKSNIMRRCEKHRGCCNGRCQGKHVLSPRCHV